MLTFLLMVAGPDKKDKVTYLYDTYHDSMMALAKSQLKRRGVRNYDIDAQDVVQEAFYKIIKSIDRIDLSRAESDIKCYVMAAIINLVKDYMLNDKPWESYDINAEIEDTECNFINELNISNRYNEVKAAIARLEDIYQVVFIFKFFQGKSVDEIAEIIGISRKAVESRIQRGRKMLHELMEEDRR